MPDIMEPYERGAELIGAHGLVRDCVQQFRVEDMSEDGQFEGWLSVYDVLEPSYRTIFDDGCDDAWLKRVNGNFSQIKLLSQHRASPEYILGDWTAMEVVSKGRMKGLFAWGKLDLEKDVALNIYRDMKAGRLNGLSRGFNVIAGYEEQRKKDPKYVFHFTEVETPEGSIVVFGGNPKSVTTKVRQTEFHNLASIESYLRDAYGASREEAKRIISGVKSALRDEGRGDDSADVLRELEALNSQSANYANLFGGK
ncbi:HK97 family phage prohead protease [bacterium]|nr:HK97 family phage prohead protease [bacterium]